MEKKSEQKCIPFIDVNHAVYKEYFFQSRGGWKAREESMKGGAEATGNKGNTLPKIHI